MANTLDDFLCLTPAETLSQWRGIMSRDTRRKKQVDFVPVEVLLCLGLFLLLNPHSFGGRNIHRLPQDALRLAKTFKRPPSSLTNKMLNLDGSRVNSARLEPRLFLALEPDSIQFQLLYLTIIIQARTAGLGAEQVPDFLGLLPFEEVLVARDHIHLLLGQEEIGHRELEQVCEEKAVGLEKTLGLGQEKTTRIVERRVRLGQHRFARQVMANYGHQCAFCGFAPRSLPGNRLLVASHIKPWRVSNDRERLDPRNGVAACPVHDSAFDSGLLTINGGLRIHRAPPLQHSLEEDAGAKRFFGDGAIHERLLVPSGGVSPKAGFLAYHHRHIYQGALASAG